MKVLHVINTLSAGGAELHLLTLCRYLKRQGAELVVACLKENISGSRSLRSDFERENIRVFNLRGDNRYDCRILVRLARLIESEHPHILHTHLPRADIGAALIRRFTSSPTFLCSVHGIYQHRWYRSWTPLMRHAYRRADAVIAISLAVKNWLTVELGIPPDKVKVIHYGIEQEHWNRGAGANLKCKEKASATIGSLGRLEPGKGFDCLVNAMSRVCKQLPDASLLIAGADTWDYGKELRSLIRMLGLQDHVRLIGFQHNVSSFLHNVDVFAFASRSEGFGQVLIEAMAAGKAVVASRIPPFTEIVVDGETGLLVNADDTEGFADAMAWLLTHSEQAREMGDRGRERVFSHFSAQKMLAETMSLYNALLKSSAYGVDRSQ